MELNIFENYYVHFLRQQNAESGELEPKDIGDKFQEKNEFILHNDLSDLRWKQIDDMMEKSYFPNVGKLDNINWMHYNNLPFLEDINSTAPIQKGGR